MGSEALYIPQLYQQFNAVRMHGKFSPFWFGILLSLCEHFFFIIIIIIIIITVTW